MTHEVPAGIAYLATPYSRYHGGPDQAYRDACKLAAHLLCCGVKVYSPIAHTHGIAVHGSLDLLDHSIWLPFDEAMMEVSSVLIVAHLEGWEDSVGVAHEIKFFQERGKPIYDLDPRSLVMVRRRSIAEHSNGKPAITSGESPGNEAELVQSNSLSRGGSSA